MADIKQQLNDSREKSEQEKRSEDEIKNLVAKYKEYEKSVKSNPRGRKPAFDADTLKRLFSAIRLGVSYRTACGFASLAESVFYDWKAKGEAHEHDVFTEFTEILNRYASTGEIALVKKITEDQSWKSAAWLLERRKPVDYGRLPDVSVTQNNVQVNRFGGMSLEDIIKENALMSKQIEDLQQSPDGVWK